MFKITSTRAIDWPSFSLRKGENVFTSRKAVPVELWEKLDRFRSLKLLDFEGKAEAGKDDGTKLEALSQAQLYSLSKTELAELAKGAGLVGLAEGVSKAELLAELERRLAPGAIAGAPAVATVTGGVDGEKVLVAQSRRGKASPASPAGEG